MWGDVNLTSLILTTAYVAAVGLVIVFFRGRSGRCDREE